MCPFYQSPCSGFPFCPSPCNRPPLAVLVSQSACPVLSPGWGQILGSTNTSWNCKKNRLNPSYFIFLHVRLMCNLQLLCSLNKLTFVSWMTLSSLTGFPGPWIEQQRRSSGSVLWAVASPESQLGLRMAERAASAAWWISIPGSRVLQRPRPRPAPSSLFGTLRSVSHRPLLASAEVTRSGARDIN